MKKETTSGKRDAQASLYEVHQKASEMIDYGGDVYDSNETTCNVVT